MSYCFFAVNRNDMKDLLRRECPLKEGVIDILNKQVEMEAHSSNAYLAMAGWCDVNGYDNCAEFFYKQSDEEKKHQMKLFKYLANMEASPVAPKITEPNHEFPNLRSVFETALDMEIAVTEAIHNVVRVCRDQNDIATEQFMRWFVMEQIEEEFVARRTLELFDVIGEDKLALAMIEERVLGVEYSEE